MKKTSIFVVFFLTGKKDPTQIIGAAQELSEKTRVSFNMMLSPHRKYVPAYLLFFALPRFSPIFTSHSPFMCVGFGKYKIYFAASQVFLFALSFVSLYMGVVGLGKV